MLGHLYPNLEQAQAKSSLKYRISSQKDQPTPVNDRPKSPQQVEVAKVLSPPRRQYHVPMLFHSQSEATIDSGPSPSNAGFFGKWNTPIVGKRRRRGEMSPSQSPSPSPEHQIDRTSLLTMPGVNDRGPVRVGTAQPGGQAQVGAFDDDTQPSLPPSLARKLEAIDQTIARTDGGAMLSQSDGGMQGSSLDAQPRRGPNILVLDPLEEATANGHPRSLQSAQAQRKVNFLLKQQDSDATSQRIALSTSPPQRRQPSSTAVGPSRQVSTKYLITTSETAPASPPALAPIVSKQESQRQLNNARVMEFVDDINNKPRGGTSTSANGTVISLDKQLRRISLVSFQQAGGNKSDERRLLSRVDSTLALRRKQMFGIYSIREVMAVIRLFWFLDADRSGGITMDELHLHRPFFQQLGRGDLGAVFRELDVDGNGTVTLSELLRVCFRTANDHQLQAMLTLAKVGNLRQYLTGRRHSTHGHDDDKNKSKIQDQRRAELEDIFHIFDSNGDGKINRVELLEALEIDQEMFAPALETSRAPWGENAKRMERAKNGGLTKADIERFYSEYDTNNDGVLDFDEFGRLMDAATS